MEEKEVDIVLNRVREMGDNRWRKIEDCEKDMEEVEKKHEDLKVRVNNNDIQFAKIETRLKVISWVLYTIGGSVIATLISVIVGFVTKG